MSRVKRIAAWVGAVVLGIPALCGAAASAGGGQTLVITQTVSGPKDGVRSSVRARQGVAQNAGGASTLDIGGRDVADVSQVPQLAVRDFGTGMTRSQLTLEARLQILGQTSPNVSGALARLLPALQAYMNGNTINGLTFNFNQTIILTGDAAPKFLSWSLYLTQGQQPYYADPQILDAIPSILQVSYVPKRVARGLPATWAYPDAGVLRWRKLDASYSPVSTWMRIDVGGAYDEPPTLAGVAVDNDQGLKCLISRSASIACPASTPTVIDLLNQAASGYAIVDYARTLQPIYDPVESPAHSVTFVQVARVALSVGYREWRPVGCTSGTFTNRGSVGFALRDQIDRYAVWADGTRRPVNTFTGTSLSPTAPFDVAKSGIVGASAASLAGMLVDVGNPTGPLVSASTIPNLQYLAPVTTRAEGAGDTLALAGSAGLLAGSIGIAASCDASGNVQLTVGLGSLPPGAQSAVFGRSQTYTLRRGVPLPIQLTQLGPATSVSWTYDGNRTVIFAPAQGGTMGPSGDSGSASLVAPLFAPGAGLLVRENFPSGGPVDFCFGSCS